MGDTVNARVDVSLVGVLEEIRKQIANDLMKKYKVDEITVYGTLASQVLAAAYNKKAISFKISKKGINKGIIEANDCITI